MTQDVDPQNALLRDTHRQLRERDDAVVFLQEEILKRDEQIEALRAETERGRAAWRELQELQATRAVRWAQRFRGIRARLASTARGTNPDGGER